MLDIKKIKENPDAVKAGLKAKEVDCDAIVDQILVLDEKVRALKTTTETKTAERRNKTGILNRPIIKALPIRQHTKTDNKKPNNHRT